MSDVAGAAPAAADSAPAPAPVDEQIVDVPNPVETIDEPVPAKVEAKAPPTIREALDKHEKALLAKQEAEAKPAKTEAKAEPKAAPKEAAKAEPVKDPATGKFVAKDKPADALAAEAKAETSAPAKSPYEAPKRFSEDAKKVWDTAPDPVKAEVSRMEREMTQGIEKHRAKAERDDTLTEFHDMAAKSGKDLKSVVAAYVGMENKLRTDLTGGLDEIVQRATNGKYSLRDVAAHILGQKPEEVQSQSDATIRELKQTVARLEQQVGGVTQTFQHQREQATLQEVTKFAEAHPRFEDLADDIGFFMQSGRAKDLSEAYTLAERLNPAPAQAAALTAEPSSGSANVTDLAEQIRKGSKSTTGALSAGSDPVASKRPSKSIRDSLDRAFAARA